MKTNGKPINEALKDIESSADTLRYYGGILPAVLKGFSFYICNLKFYKTKTLIK